MKRTLILSLTAILFIMGGNAFAAEWAIDKAHSNVGFEVKHMMFTTVPGKFTDYTGTISLDPKDLSTTSVNFTVQAASITTANDQRDTHLKSADFFDVATYPTLTFQSKKVNAMGTGMFELVGDLTIHGVTKEVTFMVEGFDTPIMFMGSNQIGGRATATINRQDFGMNWNKALDSGGVLVGDNVNIIIDLGLSQK
jgi:polyisoprenoid-binding protein YceI